MSHGEDWEIHEQFNYLMTHIFLIRPIRTSVSTGSQLVTVHWHRQKYNAERLWPTAQATTLHIRTGVFTNALLQPEKPSRQVLISTSLPDVRNSFARPRCPLAHLFRPIWTFLLGGRLPMGGRPPMGLSPLSVWNLLRVFEISPMLVAACHLGVQHASC